MKLRKGDNVVVLAGKYKGKTGEITAVLPKAGKVVVAGVNIVKRHTKPSSKVPQGGILELTKPIDVSKLMAVDPQTGVPGRIGYRINPDGSKERVFKTSKRKKVKKA
ncbi:MAG TPA: 50S ribosomal protein L24 [Candidatus Polarisedimenticolaceae bacterium]|nr:50S ribosomal protein L24 [Candidatus Polarisedimenticolaceae bacterium]